MADPSETSSGPGAAHSSGCYLNIAYAFLAIAGPRPGFFFSTSRQERKWLEWTIEGRHRGLAKFAISSDGTVEEEPINARIRPKSISSRQWGAV